jgi:hypothetical protein
MKLFRWLLSSVVFILLLIAGLLFLAQSKWAKDKIGTVLEEVALQNGVKLKIKKIEGELPLKWTLSDVHIDLSDTDSIDIDQLRIRLSIMPLLRKKIGISYLSADNSVYRFKEKESTDSPAIKSLPKALSIRIMKLAQVEVINLTTQKRATYAVSGSCHFKRRSFDVLFKMSSADLDCSLFAQGSKKNQQIAADLNLHVLSEKAFAPFATIPIETAFHLETGCAGPWKVWESLLFNPHPVQSKPITGEIKLKIDHLTAPFHHWDENVTLATHFSLFSDKSLDLSSFVVKSDLLNIEGNGRFDPTFMPKNLDCTFSLSQLSYLTSYLSGMIQGDIHYTENKCQIAISSDQFSLRNASFSDGYLNLTASRSVEGWTGSLETAAAHPELGFKGSSDFKYLAHRLKLENLSLQAPKTSLTGDFSIDLPSLTNLSGGLAFQIGDLKTYEELFPFPIAGQIGGQIDFKNNDCHSHMIAKSCKAGTFISDQVVLDLFVTDILKEPKGKIEIEIQKSYLADIFLAGGHYSMSWNSHDWTYSLQTEGWWKSPFDIAAEGHFSYSPSQVQLHCNSLKGSLLLKKLELKQPCTLTLQKNGAELSNLSLSINDGYIDSSFRIDPETSLIQVAAKHFPLDFLTLFSPRLSLQGLSSIDIALEGKNNDLIGHLNFILERADIYPAGTTTPIQTKASLQAHLNHDKIQIHSHIVATGEQFVELSATLPLSYQVYPFQLEINPAKNFAAQCTIEGHIEQLFDFVNIGTQRFGGFLSTKLVSSGTLAKPVLFGPISIQNGFYQNYLVGVSLINTNIEASANGSTIDAYHIDFADEEQGTATATGLVQIEPTFTYSVQGDISNFHAVEFNWLDAATSGSFKLSGDLNESLAEGTLTIDKAEIQIPDELPSSLEALPVTFINRPDSYKPPNKTKDPYPFRYDVHIQGEKNIHLTGHGIDAELAGSLHITGEDLNITTAGALKTNKGKFSFAGKDLKITEGEVFFKEGESFINLTSNLDLSDLNVTVTFRGSFSSPQLNFQSNPPLPTSQILARILFNKDVSELNASQAAQLAYTIINLSQGSGPNLLEKIHKNLGIDRLGISANEGKSLSKSANISLKGS